MTTPNSSIVARPASAVAAPLAEPSLSARLASAVDGVLHAHPDIGPRIPALSDAVRSEADQVLRRYEAICAPVGPETVRRWLLPLNSAVRNPLPPAEFDRRAAVIAVTVGDLPAVVFVPRTQRMALASFQFWPAAADVYALLRPEAASLTARRNALRRIAAGTPAEASPRLGQAERDAVLAKFRADMAAVRAEAQTARPGVASAPRIKSCPVTPEQLAAIRAGAAIRR